MKGCLLLDDIYIASMPGRVSEAHTIVEEELSTHAHIHLHHGKTKVWNRGGVEPEGIVELTRRARQVRPDAVVWKGDQQLPPNQQGLRVLGVPIGQPEFVLDFLEAKNRENHFVPTHPMGPGHSGSILASLHVRFDEG